VVLQDGVGGPDEVPSKHFHYQIEGRTKQNLSIRHMMNISMVAQDLAFEIFVRNGSVASLDIGGQHQLQLVILDESLLPMKVDHAIQQYLPQL
jgi:hypothetical protein